MNKMQNEFQKAVGVQQMTREQWEKLKGERDARFLQEILNFWEQLYPPMHGDTCVPPINLSGDGQQAVQTGMGEVLGGDEAPIGLPDYLEVEAISKYEGAIVQRLNETVYLRPAVLTDARDDIRTSQWRTFTFSPKEKFCISVVLPFIGRCHEVQFKNYPYIWDTINGYRKTAGKWPLTDATPVHEINAPIIKSQG